MTSIAIDDATRSSALGDPEAWVDRYGDVLLRFAMLRVRDLATAEDLVQETLLAAWRGRSGFDGGCEPRTWLIAILRRRIADHYRANGRRTEASADAMADSAIFASPIHSGGPAADQPAVDAEFWDVVSQCTSDLPDHLGRAFRQRTFGDECPTRICDAEGISRKNLSVRLHRARQLLRRCLETRWFGPGDPTRGAGE